MQQPNDDLIFLKEMANRLSIGIEKRDPTQIEYVQGMINDWIDELEEISSSHEKISAHDQAYIDHHEGKYQNPFKASEAGFEDYNKAYWEADNE